MRDYNRGLIKQIEDLTKENEELRSENKELRAENREMRQRINALEKSIEEKITKAVERATAPLKERIKQLEAENERKGTEILRLKAQINKDSSNSSKPPATNGYKKIPNNRESSGKKQGGQFGHKGCKLNIPENLDELVTSGIAEHIILTEVAEGEAYVSDWIVDIKVIVTYTEHRRKPGKPPKIEYGPQIKVIAVYLCIIGLMTYKRLTQFFHELSHNLITVSKAALAEFNRNAADAINLEPYVHDLLNGRVINVDETPIKTTERPGESGALETAEKTTFNAYIRTYSNNTTTILTANPYKTEESVVMDNILTQFHGIISQDHESKFYNFGNKHATCGAHLTRELKGMFDLQLLEWAADVRWFFLEMNRHKNEDVHNNIIACEPIFLRFYETRYDELVEKGRLQLTTIPPKSFGYDELRRMVNRLEKHKDNYLLFIRDYEAPFTNNLAERDLRHCKTKQKVSGCFRSWQGVLDYCKIRSFLATAKKRGENLLVALAGLGNISSPAGQ